MINGGHDNNDGDKTRNEYRNRMYADKYKYERQVSHEQRNVTTCVYVAAALYLLFFFVDMFVCSVIFDLNKKKFH